jgi:flagellar biosynthetic protein FlhB
MAAPIVVAKGVELVAANIRELGRTHGVPLVESPLLARALYFNSDLEQPIPVRLYLAVAQVLAYVHQLRRESRLDAEPIVISDVPVPDDLRTE